MCNLQCVKTRVTGLCFPSNSDQEKQVWLPHKLIPLWDHCARLQSANSQCFAQPLRQYLVFLAGWSRRLDELLKDAQAHEGDVFNNHWSLDVHCHKEEAESCKQTGMFIILGELQTGPSSGQHPEWVQRWNRPVLAGLAQQQDSPQRRRSSQQLSSLEMESVSSSISYWRLLACNTECSSSWGCPTPFCSHL